MLPSFKSLALSLGLSLSATAALAAQCGNTSAGFDAWKAAFAQEAKSAGVGQRGLQALAQAQYAKRTIAADRNQKSFKYSLEKFMQVYSIHTSLLGHYYCLKTMVYFSHPACIAQKAKIA